MNINFFLCEEKQFSCGVYSSRFTAKSTESHHFCVAWRPTRQEELPDLFESNPVQHARCLLILANKVSDVGKHKDNETLA